MYSQYNITNNPFGGDFKQPLDYPKFAKYFVSVDGFGKQKQEIENLFLSPELNTKFILIYGPKGTGRTSIANYIANKFCPNGPPFKIKKEIVDHDFNNSIQSWFNEISFQARINGINLDQNRI